MKNEKASKYSLSGTQVMIDAQKALIAADRIIDQLTECLPTVLAYEQKKELEANRGMTREQMQEAYKVDYEDCEARKRAEHQVAVQAFQAWKARSFVARLFTKKPVLPYWSMTGFSSPYSVYRRGSRKLSYAMQAELKLAKYHRNALSMQAPQLLQVPGDVAAMYGSWDTGEKFAALVPDEVFKEAQ